jgi:hypothetical protein
MYELYTYQSDCQLLLKNNFKNWQGMMGSNHRMSESKSDALPLGESPINRRFIYPGVKDGARTHNNWNHNPGLYH